MMLLSTVVYALLLALALVVMLPAAILLAQVLLALLPARLNPAFVGSRPRIAVLVCAHNESTGMLPTLQQALAQLAPGDRLLVVADNCSDDTARVASGAGAEVIERNNLTLRGKSYALDHGVRHLSLDPPDVVVFFDADCTMNADCIDLLVRMSLSTGRPIQSKFMTIAANSKLKMRVAEFAMRVNAHVRLRGMRRAGLATRLTGSGIAFPWSVVSKVALATGHLAEDMQLGLELGRRGSAPLYCEAACVQAAFPTSVEGQATQRTRWEHGYLSVLTKDVPPMLAWACLHMRPAFALQVVDLLVPPLSLLAVLQVVAVAVALLAHLFTGWWAPLVAALAGMAMLVLAVGIARAKFASDIVSAADLLRVPSYILAKLPIYARFFLNRQVEWVRTKRDSK